MKALKPNIDEDKLWAQSFPNYYPSAITEGVFIMPETPILMQQLIFGAAGVTQEERAIMRLDLAMSSLWPEVKELFFVDFFPHRLAAATDLLRAADFGEGPDSKRNALAKELVAALDHVEQVYAQTASNQEKVLKAAEDTAPNTEE